MLYSRYKNYKFCYIDTEGFGDKDGNDSTKSKNLCEFLKTIGHINLFLFVLKTNDCREDFLCKQMIETLK